MLVTVVIDMTKDRKSMSRAQTEPKIMAMIRVYESNEDESYLEKVGQHLWNICAFADVLVEHCGDDLYGFGQTECFLFEFVTTPESAMLFKLSCHAPEAVTIVERPEPVRITPDVRFDIEL